jgi:glycosyltransferase involved in cell wall biosynthesis
MKIAIVLNTSWNIYNFRMNFIKSLLAEGHEVHTVAPVDDYTQQLQQAGCIHHSVTMDSRGANPIRDFGLIIELWSIYRKLKPDIILHYTIKPNIYGTLAASLLKIPVINNVCGLGTVFLKKGLVSVVAMKLYRWAFRYPKKVFFQNSDDRKLFLDRKLVPSDIADLIPGSGVDLKRFTPGTQARNEKFTFLLISRLITDKGVLEFIGAVKQLKSKGFDAKFQILGPKDPQHKRGIQLKTIDEWIQTGLVEYLGTTDDVRQHINKADCVVLPSYREGTPRTLLEAASSAKPIIATDVPGCHHVVVDQYNGLLCKMKDVDDLADKMLIMAGLDETVLKEMGVNGRRKMELEFSEDLVISKYIAAILPFKKAS